VVLGGDDVSAAAALGGLADLTTFIRSDSVELLPVVDELRVGGELLVVADVEAKCCFGVVMVFGARAVVSSSSGPQDTPPRLEREQSLPSEKGNDTRKLGGLPCEEARGPRPQRCARRVH
jgi:hypothetical protein